MNRRYALVASRAGHHCEYCRAPEVVFNMQFEVEHIIPPSRGGSDVDDNLALACRACNVYKSAHVTGEDDASRTEARLFHPRRDSWNEHFTLDRQSGMIRGLSAVGRATVSRLNMNLAIRLPARLIWMRLGLLS